MNGHTIRRTTLAVTVAAILTLTTGSREPASVTAAPANVPACLILAPNDMPNVRMTSAIASFLCHEFGHTIVGPCGAYGLPECVIKRADFAGGLTQIWPAG